MSKRWFIVTNTENLEFFFSCGLIVDPQGFPDNAYIIDPMNDIPVGYIPLFSEDNLFEALKKAKEEDVNLSDCLLEIDFRKLKSHFFVRQPSESLDNYAELALTSIAGSILDEFNEILLRAPLPISALKKIILRDSRSQYKTTKAFESLYNHTSAKFITIEPKMFGKASQKANLLERSNPELPNRDSTQPLPNRVIDYQRIFSFGGAVANLYYQTKNGRFSTKIFNEFVSQENKPFDTKFYTPFLAYFSNSPSNVSEESALYSLILRHIRNFSDIGESRYDLLDLLQDQEQLPNSFQRDCDAASKSLKKLVDRSISQDTDSIISKVLGYYNEEHSKIFLLLTMFFLRDHTETMLTYHHDQFQEEDYMLFSIFYGAINYFTKTPSFLRRTPDLSLWISFKMAEFANRSEAICSTIFLEPPKPILIHERFFPKSSGDYRLHDFYDWFGKYIMSNSDNFVSWKMTTKGEYLCSKGTMTFGTRQVQHAEIDFDKLEKNIILSIGKSANIFDVADVICAYKKYTKSS